MQDNPLKAPILRILKESTDDLSEYALFKHLESNCAAFQGDDKRIDIALFRKHFMVMNALYQLQDSLVKDGLYLAISALSIKIEPIKAGENKTPANCPDAKLRDYYLDWSQLSETTESDVNTLLTIFWKQYCAYDKHADAFNTLGLDSDETWPAIQQTYRRLAAESHPDRGGNNEQFIAIREAYETLKLNRTLYNRK